MGQGILRWEDMASLTHHCPGCERPLTNGRARTKCLGEHVECCKAFHPHLYAIGSNWKCSWCTTEQEVHSKRCRTIAETSREILKLQSAQDSTTSARTVKGHRYQDPQDNLTATTKRQRKELKKAEKAAHHSVAITHVDIHRVEAILYPTAHSEDGDLEEPPVHDHGVLHNLAFHPNTCQGSNLRQELIANDRNMSVYDVPDRVVLDCMNALGVKARHCPKNSDERKLLDSLKDTIQLELLTTGRERQQTLKREGAFLRWAHKNGYKKLVERCVIWDWQRDAMLPKAEAAGPEVDNAIDAEDHTGDSTLPTDGEADASALDTSSDDDSLPSLTSTATDIDENDALDDTNDAPQTTLRVPPTMTLKFYHNNGLHHLKSTPDLHKQWGKLY